MKRRTTTLGLALAHAGIAMTVASGAAVAQQAQKIEKIEVTGSNIKRLEGEGALPVTVITRQDIERSGATSVEEIMRRVSSNTATYSDTTQGVGYAVSTANLRGIGAVSYTHLTLPTIYSV